MQIAVIGLGYVGCVAVGKLSLAGHDVWGVDINKKKVELINAGKSTVSEPGLDELLLAGKQRGNLRATTDLKSIVNEVDIFYVCVGTPRRADGRLDHTSIFNVADRIVSALKDDSEKKIFINRSTVEPGTNAELKRIFDDKRISVVMNPEFLREGSALNDWDEPGLIVIGTFDDFANDVVQKLYAGIEGKFVVVRPETAEIIKYVNNSWHALKVCFANEIGRLCDINHWDHQQVIDVFLSDKKLNLSGSYLRPGMPYGGSCLPKDLSALNNLAERSNLNVPILHAIAESNSIHTSYITKKICDQNRTSIGFWGLAFKENTDDLRNSSSIEIVKSLLAKEFQIRIFDPNICFERLIGQNRDEVMDLIPILEKLMVNDLNEMIMQVDLIVVTQNVDSHIPTLSQLYPDKIFMNIAKFDMEFKNEN